MAYSVDTLLYDVQCVGSNSHTGPFGVIRHMMRMRMKMMIMITVECREITTDIGGVQYH